MKKKYTLTLDDEFIQYCKLNDVDYVEKLAKETFNRGFSLLKYGETPSGKSKIKEVTKEVIKEVLVPVEVVKEVIKEVPVEKIVEKIVEKVVEIPIEVIKEVIKEVKIEVIKEVPIEIQGDVQIVTKEIIKEVPIEVIKEVTVEVIKEVIKTDDTEINRLKELNTKLQSELDKITNSLNNFSRAKFMKNSNLGSLYDE
jgi:hypothetical protein